MSDLILISGLQESGVHGVLPEERVSPQPFAVDIELSVDVSAAGLSDELDDTVDYGNISLEVARVVREESYFLLERLATRIAEVCREDERVTGFGFTLGQQFGQSAKCSRWSKRSGANNSARSFSGLFNRTSRWSRTARLFKRRGRD